MVCFPLSFLSEDKESEFSAGSLSLARKVGFMIANSGEDFVFNQMCGFLYFFSVLNRISGIDLCHSNIVIMSVHYFLTAFRSMLGTCHNQILFIWRLSRMPRHLNASKRNTAALTDCAMALLLPAASHNLRLPADLRCRDPFSCSTASALTSLPPTGCIVFFPVMAQR